MKRFFTLLLVFTAVFCSRLVAQCNPEFTFTINGATGQVQFTPVNTNTVEHTWLFGDGASSNIAAPLHQYAPGVYNVVHVVMFRSPNDSSVQCIDSLVRPIAISGQQPCDLNAAFSFTRDSVQTNKVYFTNLSTGLNPNTITQWTFGDGTSSFESNPVHIFPTSSVLYQVCLIVRRDNLCASDTCAMVQVQAPDCNLAVNYSSQADSLHPNTIQFTNLTQLAPTDSVTWLFGDGQMSGEFNPSHTYANPGSYNVCLVITRFSSNGVVCTRELCRAVTIGQFCNINPGFVFFRDTTANPFPAIYNFSNITSGLSSADSSFWNFGDGTPVVINPGNPFTHTYTAPGVYTVCLKVKKVQAGTINIICERQFCQTVIVDTPQVQCNLQAFFTAQRDSSLLNKFYFNNLTQGLTAIDSVRWTFGDGSNSAVVNPVHTYSAPGTYQVCLRVKRTQVPGTPPCVDEYCQSIVVQQQTTCNLVVGFEDSTVNNTVYFTNFSTPLAATDSIRWTFGDGSSSADVDPVHTYNQPGSYTVCLRVKKAPSNTTAPCVREFCRVITIAQPCNIAVNYTAVRDSSPANPGNTFIFTNTSTGLSSIDSSFWSFGDGTPMVFAPSATVTHTYTTNGIFSVCLIVKKIIPGTNITACVRESCRTITVQQNACNFVANFTYLSDSINGGAGNVYSFTNTSAPLLSIDSSFWNFGDGSPIVINPSAPLVHTYANPGTYTVCLLVKKVVPGTTNILCERQECKTIVVLGQSNPCDQLQVNFEWRRDSANNRLIHFINPIHLLPMYL
jgi:PKD repeat protein